MREGLDEAGGAYVALPGGLGTLEEILEILSFKQLRLHDKPVVVLNAFGYWDSLLAMIEHGLAEGFIPSTCRDMFTVAENPQAAIEQIEATPAWRPSTHDSRGGGTG